MRGSKKPSVEELLPLRLVGDFCSWQVEVPGLELQSNGSLMGGKVLEFILLLQLEELVKFQIISSPLGFRARIYPKEDAALVKDAGQMGASEANGLVGGSGDGHGRNFIISDLKVKALLVRLALGKRGMEGPPLAAQVCFTLEPTRSGPTVAIGAGKVSLVGQTHVAWSDDPEQLRLQQLLPLRLVGHPCGWRLEQSGLVLTATHHEGPWQGHSLCMRLLTREVEFQIVSDKFGFAWRVFPGGTAKLPQCDGPSAALPAQQGGKDDGFGRNFLITGRPLSVITLLVWLNVEDEQVKGIRLAQGPTASSSKPSVAVGARRVQYPVLSQLTPLGPELLEAAETEDEKQAALEQRTDCVRRVAWRLQEEYAAEDVQWEVLALRQLYPYQQKKSILALEMEGHTHLEEEPEEEGVQSYVRAAQELKKREKQAEEVEGKPGEGAEDTEATPGGEKPEALQAVPEGTTEEKTAEEELRRHCLRGLKAIERQVAQHSESPDDQSDPSQQEAAPKPHTLALLPQRPSALAGALAMCEGDTQAAAMAGAREAHLEQLRKQGQILSRSLAILEEDEEEMPEEKVNTEALHALMKRENLFGDTDAQFNNAVQNLPSVKAARERAMQALDLPTSLYPTAVRMTELQHWTDRVSHQANILCLKRLRLLAGPHPAVCRQAAEALVTTGIMSGHGSGLFFGLEAVPQDFPEVLEELNRAWKGGHFGHWFGGPRAGRYLTCTLEDFWSWKFFHLFAIVLRMQDDLQLILEQMGSEGQRLSMEQQIMISFHSRGQQLPPWEDGAGRRSRRISLVFHPSHSHRRVSEGGALRLHKKGTAQVVEVPGGSAHWAIFRTAEVRQEVTKVNLPCGRWCITVCAEDTELARKLRPEHSALVNRAGTDVGGPEPVREVTCDCCSFSAGDGILLTCPGQHRLCRNCLLMELRRESVPSCTACAGEGDRIHLSSVWELMSQDHTALDDLGCCCTPGAEGCDSQIDVGAQVVVFGQSKSSGLNGQRGWTLWWDFEKQLWEVLLPSGRVLALRGSELALAEACEGRCIYDCPAWQVGRGLYPVSLGNRCCVKLGIDECSGDAHCPVGYPYFHGAEYLPFDSLLTSLDAVLFFLRHDFANFFHYNDMVDVHPPGLERIIFHNYRSWMHTFPHHHPQLDQPKLDRRIRRFRVLCRHSRDVRGARPLLFVRYVGDAPGELQRLEELYSLLRLWGGPNIRLCYVLMLQRNKKMPMSTPAQLGWDALTHRGSVGSLGLTATSARGRLYRHAEYPKVLFYLVDGLVDVMDFSVIRQALRFNVYDHAGLLLDCPAVTTGELLEMIAPFKDPYTNKSQTCIRTWLERPTEREQEVVNGFFPDCPRAQQPDQGRQPNQVLRLAVQRLDLRKLQGVLSDADANTWDAHGRRPLHDLCHVAGEQRSRCGLANILQIAAELLLAHGDPRARDKDGTTALALCRRLVPKKAPPELLALLRVAALDDCGARACPMPVLFRALELMGEPLRSKVSVNLFGLKPLRAVSDAELAWRTPSLGLKEQLEELDAELAQIQRMKPTARRKAIRRLLFEWHPDKNQHRHELATEAFQYLQVRKAELLKQTKPS